MGIWSRKTSSLKSHKILELKLSDFVSYWKRERNMLFQSNCCAVVHQLGQMYLNRNTQKAGQTLFIK